MYTNEVFEQEGRDRQRRLNERNAEVWEEILNTTDQTPGTAFFERVVKWAGGTLTLDAYDMLCATSALPGFESPEWHKGTDEFYIKQVVDKLQARRWDEKSIQNKVVEMRNWTKPQIRAYLQELGFREVVRTADEARDYLQRNRLLQSQQAFFTRTGAGPYPRLPLHNPNGGMMDAKYIKSLDAAAIINLNRIYSGEQVTKRIQDTRDSLRQQSEE